MKTIWIILITFAVTSVIVGADGYAYMENKIKKEKLALQTEIDNLNKELGDLKSSETPAPGTAESAGGSAGASSESIYTDNDNHFSITLPDGWEVKSTYYYETAGGEKAKVPTIVLGRKSDTSEDNTNKININLRQSSCQQLSPIPDRSEPAGDQSVEIYIASGTDTFCVSAEVEGQDNSGKKATYQFVSFYSDTSVKEAFKTIVGSFKVL